LFLCSKTDLSQWYQGFLETKDLLVEGNDRPGPEENAMDATRCPHCKKRLMAMTDAKGRTDLRCLKCDKIVPTNAGAKQDQAARA
jgi:DNA-directed RNA polymerase subunit RPC12/RpoP